MASNEHEHDRRMGLNDSDVFGDESQAWGMEKDLDWRLAWQRAVAKAWALPAYQQKLLESPALALREVGWEVPKGLELKVELAAEGVGWDASVHERALDPDRAGGHIAANGWASKLERHGELSDRRDEVLKALKTTVTMRLPPAPKEDRFLALAMADYDGLSRAYPFTCAVC
jgi:hypothetical protein